MCWSKDQRYNPPALHITPSFLFIPMAVTAIDHWHCDKRMQYLWRFLSQIHHRPFLERWDSKWSSGWKSESRMVIIGLFSTSAFEKILTIQDINFHSAGSMSISSLIFSGIVSTPTWERSICGVRGTLFENAVPVESLWRVVDKRECITCREASKQENAVPVETPVSSRVIDTRECAAVTDKTR